MRWALVACLLAGCYRPNLRDCAVSCADGAGCPDGLACGTDQRCHSGSIECSEPEPDASLPPPDAARRAFCALPQLNTVACFEFDGNAIDSSSNHLAVTGATTYRAGHNGMALSVIQSSNVRITDSAALDLAQFTIEAWLYQTATTSNNVLVAAISRQYGIYVDPGDRPFCVFTKVGGSVLDPVTARTPTALVFNRWTHIACTYDHRTLTLYVDGVAVQPATASMEDVETTPTGGGIGGDADHPDAINHWTGAIDELRIVSKPRSASEICEDAGRTGCAP